MFVKTVAFCVVILSHLTAFAGAGRSDTLKLDETPAGEREWGYRPASQSVSAVTPPSFTWRPQKGIVSWEIECTRDDGSRTVEYRREGVKFNVHCPPRTFPAGAYVWRYRGVNAKGSATNWSCPRNFTIARQAAAMPLPTRAELLARIPQTHPRLFVRPEEIPHLRELARGPLKDQFDALVRQSEELLRSPPPTAEPPEYPPDTEKLGEEWREIWWGNRMYTIRALNGAATLAFTRLLGGKEEYALLAKRILLDCSRWDPRGSTGYDYNDEAGMPYAYYFSRTYTFLHDHLTEEEREACRRVMKVRGDEMLRDLYPRHFWDPYDSHNTRAWHFLGEVGIAFLDEVEGADEWIWFAANVFFNVYPSWSDDDGGWHQGISYWRSYLERFTWWADVMRTATGINAYDKPFFSKAGYFAMYIMPPGKIGGGFGDLNARKKASDNVSLMTTFATQAQNAHWQWYVEQVGGPRPAEGYIGFVRGALPRVAAHAPDDLPGARLFRGTGHAYLNTDLTDGRRGVQVGFKSSPFGCLSHGYEANNSFILWAHGQRLLVRSGYRDIHGSEHHNRWMHSTRSVNNITVNGTGQVPYTASARGDIVAFETTPSMDIVIGEAGSAYRVPASREERSRGIRGPRMLDRYTRAILFVKPGLVIVYDRLVAREPSSFDYWLHAVNEFAIDDQHGVRVHAGDVRCDINFLAPRDLTFQQTNQYDPNPRPRIKLREWHLTATTPGRKRAVEFVTLYRPRRARNKVVAGAQLTKVEDGYALRAELEDGHVVALLPTSDTRELRAHGIETRGAIVIERRRTDGSVVQTLRARK